MKRFSNPYTAAFKALVIVIITGLMAVAALAAPLQVREEITVDGAAITVQDLFAKGKILPRSLAHHKAAPFIKSPLPGEERLLSGSYIKSRLTRLAGVSALEIDTPARIRIRREGQRADDALLKPILMQAASELWSGAIALTRFRVVGRRSFPKGDLTIHANTTKMRVRRERMELPVTIHLDGKPAGRLTLCAQVALIKHVVVATSPIRQGESILPSQLSIKKSPVTPSDTAFFTSTRQLTGRVAALPIRTGAIITPRATKAPLAVKRGDGVRITYRKNGLVVTATGIASKGGAVGDTISVKNIRSKTRLTCRITGNRRVEPLI